MKCFGCLTEDVSVKVIDLCGIAVWFCAGCWAAEQKLHEGLMNFLNDAVKAIPGAGKG